MKRWESIGIAEECDVVPDAVVFFTPVRMKSNGLVSMLSYSNSVPAPRAPMNRFLIKQGERIE